MHATLCDLMADIVQNAMEADASEVILTLRETDRTIEFEVKDNGIGMSKEIQDKAVDPFYSDGRKHAHRRVGLGLPFLFQTAEAAGGSATIESKEGQGTVIQFQADATHVDLPPVGDFAGAATMMLSMADSGELRIRHSLNQQHYTLSKNELHEALGGLQTVDELDLLKTYIESQEDNLRKAG